MTAQMIPLLTVPEVAQLLQLSESAVYFHSHRLGGFYPAGIRALRFRREDIYAIMEGSQERQLEVPVPTSGPTPQQDRIQNKGRGPKRTGSPPKEPDRPADSSIIADSVRFGLRDSDGGVFKGG
jgi:predicted DNA-binding transcriptional regulator AlpA